MSTARDFRLPKMNTSQALGAGIAAGALALYVLTKRRNFYRAPSDDTPRVGSENDEIEIYGFQEMSDIVSSLSPYVAKVEAWMKFVGLPYTKKIGTPATAPKGQLPYIKHGDNVVADSTFIIKYLQRTYPDVDRPLSAEQEALSVMMTHYIEDSLYLGLFYHRWIQSTGWESIKELIMATVPGFGSLFVRYILGARVRPNMMAKLKYQGLGKHSETDINMLIDEELAALSQMLGEKPYLLGEQPCIADAAAFGFLDNALASEGVSPDLRELIIQYSNLVAYTERIRTSYFDAEPRFEEAAEEAAED